MLSSPFPYLARLSGASHLKTEIEPTPGWGAVWGKLWLALFLVPFPGRSLQRSWLTTWSIKHGSSLLVGLQHLRLASSPLWDCSNTAFTFWGFLPSFIPFLWNSNLIFLDLMNSSYRPFNLSQFPSFSLLSSYLSSNSLIFSLPVLILLLAP